MATERMSHPRSRHEKDAPAAHATPGATVLPSQRVVTPPTPGSDEAAFLANLNEVYGGEDPADDAVLEGIRRRMQAVLTHTP